jgi:hypothetical protein
MVINIAQSLASQHGATITVDHGILAFGLVVIALLALACWNGKRGR